MAVSTPSCDKLDGSNADTPKSRLLPLAHPVDLNNNDNFDHSNSNSDTASHLSSAAEQAEEAASRVNCDYIGDDQRLLVTDTVTHGSYRRPSTRSNDSFQSVTSCSPLPSPPTADNSEAGTSALSSSSKRGGRRRLVRSGTSGSLGVSNRPSLSPSSSFSAAVSSRQSPLPNEELKHTASVDPAAPSFTGASAETSASLASSTDSSAPAELGDTQQPTMSHGRTGDAGSTHAESAAGRTRSLSTSSAIANLLHRVVGGRSSEEDFRTPLHEIEAPVLNAPHAEPSQRPARARSASHTSSNQGSLRLPFIRTQELPSPSQYTPFTDTEEYFSAHPLSPSDQGSILQRGKGKARALLKNRISWSGHSHASSALADADLEVDDEACYVDDDFDGGDRTTTGLPRCRRVDFLSRLPSELALCILFALEDHVDVLAAAAVSRSWRRLALDGSVWRHLFFSHPGWAIREDAPLVLQHQAELRRIQIRAANLSANVEEQRRQLESKFKSERNPATLHAYAERLASLKTWGAALHMPSLPDLSGLSLGRGLTSKSQTQAQSTQAGSTDDVPRASPGVLHAHESQGAETPRKRLGVDTDGARSVVASSSAASSSSAAAHLTPFRSPTAASGRFGLFLSPAPASPLSPAGRRRALGNRSGTNDSLSSLTGSIDRTTDPARAAVASSASSLDESIYEAEEYFAASLDWIKLYRDRFVLDQRWFSGKRARGEDGVVGTAGGSTASLLTSSSSSSSRTGSLSRRRSQLARALSSGSSSLSLGRTASKFRSSRGEAKPFEPTRRYLCGHEDSVYCVRQDDGVGTGTSGKLVSGSRDRTIRIWDAESGECRHILRGHTASVLSLQYDDQILVSGSSDSEVFVWDFAAIMATPSGVGEGADGSQNDRSVSSVSGDVATGKPRQEAGQKKADPVTHGRHRVLTKLRGHSSAVLDVAFDADWIVTSSKDASVRVWKRSDYSLYRKFTHGGPVNAVDLQGGRIVTASGDGSMFLWDIEQGSAIHAFQGHSKGLACISFRGDTVVSGSNDQTIRIWNANTGRCRKVLQGHSELVRTVGYCPVRELVVSGGYDRAIKIWDARTEDDRPDTQVDAEGHPETSESAADHHHHHNHHQQQQQRIQAAALQSDHPSHPDLGEQANAVSLSSDEDGGGDRDRDRDGDEDGERDEQIEIESESDGNQPRISRTCLPIRDLKCHRARVFDIDLNTTRIVSASEDHSICISFFGGQGIDTALFV